LYDPKQVKSTAGRKGFDTLIIPDKLRLRRSEKIPTPVGFFLSLKSQLYLSARIDEERYTRQKDFSPGTPSPASCAPLNLAQNFCTLFLNI
jgi:hypothetical protein